MCAAWSGQSYGDPDGDPDGRAHGRAHGRALEHLGETLANVESGLTSGRVPRRCHADTWAVATCNGMSLASAWAGLDHMLDAAPRLLFSPARQPPRLLVAAVCLVAGNAVLVASRQLGNQFRTRLGLSAPHVLEKARFAESAL